MDQKRVKKWLKDFNHSRTWLAKECNAAPQTINNWLSTSRGIPNRAKILIERLMEADYLRKTNQNTVTQTLTLEFNSRDFDMIEQAARLNQMKIRNWATQTLREIATRDANQLYNQLQVAEEKEPYPAQEKK